jgi:hypothetical protein
MREIELKIPLADRKFCYGSLTTSGDVADTKYLMITVHGLG